ARHLIEPGRLRSLLQVRQRRRCLVIAEALVPLVVGVCAQTQRPVVDTARTPECPPKHGGLFGGWIESIAVRAFLLHAYTYKHSVLVVSEQAWRTTCMVDSAGDPPETGLTRRHALYSTRT